MTVKPPKTQTTSQINKDTITVMKYGSFEVFSWFCLRRDYCSHTWKGNHNFDSRSKPAIKALICFKIWFRWWNGSATTVLLQRHMKNPSAISGRKRFLMVWRSAACSLRIRTSRRWTVMRSKSLLQKKEANDLVWICLINIPQRTLTYINSFWNHFRDRRTSYN